MSEVEIKQNSDGTVTIPVKVYRSLERKAAKYDKVYASNAAKGSKRWANTTPEERKAAMAELAAKRKAAQS